MVAAVRRLLRQPRVGHAGTLDPAATGLLVVLAGRATRLSRFVSALPKRYQGTIRFGAETATDDGAGAVTATDESWRALEAGAVAAALAAVAASPAQVPPAVSAKKVDGERAYRLARRGTPADLAPVNVTVSRLVATRFALPEVDVDVECSSGTYVRAVARDVGRALGTRAHLAALRRTGIGPWDVADATRLEGATADSLEAVLRPLAEAVAHLPALAVEPEAGERVRHGGKLAAPDGGEGPVRVEVEGVLVAVAEHRDGCWAPVVVLAP